MSNGNLTDAMIEAGVAAAASMLPEELTEADPELLPRLVKDVFDAMAGQQWRTIASAPRHSPGNIMLGYSGPRGFEIGIGRYMVENDDTSSGQWSTEAWWGAPPTHWMPMPEEPKAQV